MANLARRAYLTLEPWIFEPVIELLLYTDLQFRSIPLNGHKKGK